MGTRDAGDWSRIGNALSRMVPGILASILLMFGTVAWASDWEAAIDRWTMAVQERPTDAMAHRELGKAYLGAANERVDRAERRVLLAMADLELGQAVTINPLDSDAKRALAHTAILSDNPYQAIRIYEDLIRKPTRGRLEDASQLFTLYVATGMIEHGLMEFEGQLQKEKKWHELRFLTALMYQKDGNPAMAKRLLNQVATARDAADTVRRAAKQALKAMSP